MMTNNDNIIQDRSELLRDGDGVVSFTADEGEEILQPESTVTLYDEHNALAAAVGEEILQPASTALSTNDNSLTTSADLVNNVSKICIITNLCNKKIEVCLSSDEFDLCNLVRKSFSGCAGLEFNNVQMLFQLKQTECEIKVRPLNHTNFQKLTIFFNSNGGISVQSPQTSYVNKRLTSHWVLDNFILSQIGKMSKKEERKIEKRKKTETRERAKERE